MCLGRTAVPSARFAARCALGLAGVLVLAVLAVRLPDNTAGTGAGTAPAPNAGLEGGLPGVFVSLLDFVIDITAEAGWVIAPAAVVFLLVRRLNRLALFAAVTSLGALAIGLVFTELPAPATGSLQAPDTTEGYASISSLFTAVAGGAFLLVFLPPVPARRRGWAITATAAAVLLFGAVEVLFRETRPVAVAGGWLAALLWLTVTTSAFRRWDRDIGLPRQPLTAGLSPTCRQALRPAPVQDPVFPTGARGAGLLAVTALLLWGFLTAAGWLVTGPLAPVRSVDSTVMAWFANHRSEGLTAVASVMDHVGNTPGIIAVLLAAIPTTLAATRRRAPAAVLLIATAGETAIFLTAQAVVARPRPAVEHLAGEPATSSFPSGHVAASFVTYCCLALILSAWTRHRLRWVLFTAAALLVAAVAITRLYLGMHYPTDILASLLFAPAWLAVCWRTVKPARGSPAGNGSASSGTPASQPGRGER
jgi:undecaprenyl-diphosphatase